MILCVWTAVHLNVPIPGTVWGPRVRKVGWLVLALLAPEMVAYTAWYVCSDCDVVCFPPPLVDRQVLRKS